MPGLVLPLRSGIFLSSFNHSGEALRDSVADCQAGRPESLTAHMLMTIPKKHPDDTKEHQEKQKAKGKRQKGGTFFFIKNQKIFSASHFCLLPFAF